MMKFVFSALCISSCLVALPALAATPDTTPLSVGTAPSSAPEKLTQTGAVKIGEHYCPAAPEESALPNKAKQTLTLVSATCIMEASGLITHDEAQSVYDMALGNIQMALAEIQMPAPAPALASK